MANPKQLSNMRVSALHVNSTLAALKVHSVDESGAYVSPGAGSTQVSIKEILSSSGGSLIDSSNVSLGVTIRAGSAAGTEYTDGDVDATISGQAILFDNSTNTLRPVTLTRGLPVNLVAGQSTITTISTGSVRVHQSTAADLNVTVAGYSTIATISTGSVRVHQSTAADLNVTVAGYSTIATVSTGSVRVHQSTAADLLATVSPGSTTWTVQSRVTTSSGGGVEGSTTTQSTGGVLGLNVREVMPSGRQSTTLVITSTHSTALYALISSAAALKQKVTAYFVGSTHTNPSTLVFMSSNAIDRWAINFGSGSSGITGANLATVAPDWLFETDAANALNCRIEGGSSVTSTVIARVSIKWFSEA